MTPEAIQKIIDAAAEGWDGLEKPSALMEAASREIEQAERAEAMRQARVLAACFETPAGREALALLRAKTYARPATQGELDERDPMAFALTQARLQGAANLVHMIEGALAVARGKEDDDVS